MTTAQGLTDEELDAAIARRSSQTPQRPPGRARYLSDEEIEREISRRQDIQRRRPQIDAEVNRRALTRARRRLMAPFALGQISEPIADVFRSPRRRENAAQGLRNTGSDIASFFNQSPSTAWEEVQRGASRGVSRIPGTLWEMGSHPGETLRAMTYGPFQDAEQHQQELDAAELEGDDAAADEAAAAANSSTLDAGINTGGLLLGGSGAVGRRAGLGAFAAQTRDSALLGAGLGGAIGGLRTPGSLEDRVAGATEGAGVGGTIGALAPTGVNLARAGGWAANNAPRIVGGRSVTDYAGSLQSAAGRLIDDMSSPDPNSVGAFGRPPRRRPTTPPQRGEEPVPQEERIARMYERARMGGDDLEAAATAARANPQGQRAVDLAGVTGVRELRPVAQGTGETGALAETVRAERFRDAPGIVAERARTGLGVSETPHQATLRLDNDYRGLSAQAYEPLWSQRLSARQIELFDQRIAPMLDSNNPDVAFRNVMQDAIARAEDQFSLDRAEGLVRGDIRDNLPRYLHYIKGAIGEVAQFEASPLQGASGRRVSSIRRIYHRFSDAIDPLGGEAIIPGYREITARAGDNFTAREAMAEGGEWINRTGEEVADARRAMTPFELEHARIALAERIRVASRGVVSETRNPLNGILNDPDALAAIEAAFDTPEQAASFIETVNTQRQLLINASQWGGGSQTYSNASYGLSGALHAARAVHNPIEGGLALVAKWLDEAGVERSNNQFGESALRRVDDTESVRFVRRIASILRRREQARAAASAAANATAATASTPQSRERSR